MDSHLNNTDKYHFGNGTYRLSNTTDFGRLVNSSTEAFCQTTVSHLCSDEFPDTRLYYQDKGKYYPDAILIGICCLLTALISLLFLLVIKGVLRIYRDPIRRQRTLVVLGIYPIEAFFSCLSLLVPRATSLLDLTASCYLGVCIYTFLEILFMYFGGPDNMVKVLGPRKIDTNAPPLCCCCVCLPKITFNRKKLRLLKIMVMQVAFIRPFLLFIVALLWTDNRKIIGDVSSESAFLYITIITTISTLLAIYTLQILVKASQDILSGHRIKLKFFLIQMVLVTTNLQNGIFVVLARHNLPPCLGILGSKPRAANYHHMLIVLEIFLLFLGALAAYRRSESRSIDEEIIIPPPNASAVEHGLNLVNKGMNFVPKQDTNAEVKNLISETI